MRKQPWFKYVAGLCLGIAAVFGSSAPGMAAGKDMAVLVVGKSSDAAMATVERSLIEDLTRLRVNKGWSHKALPIFSYHFDKASERTYCEERLKVKSSDLVTVGLVDLEGGVPVAYVYRENTVSNAAQASDKVMARAQTELAARGTITAASKTPMVVTSPPPGSLKKPKPAHPIAMKPAPKKPTKPTVKKPAAETTKPVVAAAPQAGTSGPWAIQVGLFSTLQKARLMAGKVKDDGKVEIRKSKKDSAIMYRVMVGYFPSQTEAYSKAKQMQGAGYEAFSVRVEPSLGSRVP